MKITALLTAALLTLGCSSESKDTEPDPSDTGTERDTDTSDDTGSEPEPEPDCTDFKMKFLEGSTDLPSVIQIIFRLKCDGEPVPGLTEEDFSISEDGASISIFESDQQIVPTVARYQLSTLLMLDMSGSMVESGNLPALQEAASAFIESLSGEQEVSIYTFDGQESPTLLVPFTGDNELLQTGIASLTDYEVMDTSTNLNGAVLSGLAILDVEATAHTDKLFGGTMAIFTDGKDQAGRVTNDVAADAAQGTDHAVYTVGLGGEIAEDHLSDVGKDGALFAIDVDALDEAFDALASDILAEANSLYILAYCSPKRAGTHDLKLKLNDSSAKLNYTFDATGFEGGCDPNDFVPPEFLDLDGDGYRPYDGDCDDEDASRFPGAAEDCDGVDNNCNDEIDEGVVITVFYDGDADGYGDPDVSIDSCDGISGYVADNTDCDDDDFGVNPGALEYCDDIDNDCNGVVDDAGESFVYYRDADGDGIGSEDITTSSTECTPPEGYTTTTGDCDDSDASVYPGAPEYCNDTDDDCDGVIDDSPVDGTTYYVDADGDGWGDSDDTTVACSLPSGHAESGGDVDDSDPDIGVSATDEMVLIDSGEFTMTAGWGASYSVTLTNDFWMGSTEVTQHQFESVMGYNPASMDSCGPTCPVETINWHEAAAFTNALSDIEGLEACYECDGEAEDVVCSAPVSPYSCAGYRLATEAEWEYAARCHRYDHTYSGSADPTDVAWYLGVSGGITHPVAELMPNDCGLYDMSGNVYEWVGDRYGAYGFDDEDPESLIDPEGAATGSSRSSRGGSYDYSESYCDITHRYYDLAHVRSTRTGLRVARTAD